MNIQDHHRSIIFHFLDELQDKYNAAITLSKSDNTLYVKAPDEHGEILEQWTLGEFEDSEKYVRKKN